MDLKSGDFWTKFITELAYKAKSLTNSPTKLRHALDNAIYRPNIYLAFGIHGNILFPDAGYCEFDDPEKAWLHLKHWAELSSGCIQSPIEWQNCFPVDFEVGIVSIKELAKKYPIWELLTQHQVDFINPLYSQPYLRHLGEESNYHQFEYGLETLTQYRLNVKIFASSEHALHPQIPQLLEKFGIPTAFATVRLAGGAPISYQPKVIWIGRDGSEILTIVAQSGLSNGHIWHGKIFEEFPGLIFQAIARPDLDCVVYGNIEDFANPFPGSSIIAKNIADFERNRIYFRHFHSIAKDDQIPISRRVQWSIDEFPIGFMMSKLIAATRFCEDLLVNAEAIDSLLFLENKTEYVDHTTDFDLAWEKLLITENHDAFAVPFTTPGMYSRIQGFEESKTWENTETIENRCLRMISEVEKIVHNMINEIPESNVLHKSKNTKLVKKTSVKKRSSNKTVKFAYYNWLWNRSERFGDFKIELPEMGYTTILQPYEICHKIEFQSDVVQIDRVSLNFGSSFQMNSTQLPSPGCWQIQGTGWKVKLIDCPHRVEIELNTEKEMELAVKIAIAPQKLYITYPFGAESTGINKGHTLRFWWQEGGVVFAHSGTPYYKWTSDACTLIVPRGNHRFALSTAKSLVDAYHRAWEFFYPSQNIAIPKNDLPSQKIFDINYNGTIPTALRRRKNGVYLRVFSIDGSLPQLSNGQPIDFNGNPTTHSGEPWKILNYRIM